MKKVIAIDIGSSSIKACVFEYTDSAHLLYSKTSNISLYSPKPGYAEHNADQIWNSLCASIKAIFEDTSIKNDEISCVSICSQAQCVILVDKDGNPLTPIYNSQDARAHSSYKKYYADHFLVEGVNVFKFLAVYAATGFTPGGAKDPVFKYKWAEDNLPEIYKNAYKWLDIKDFIIHHLTGNFLTTKDNAHAYTVYNSGKNSGKWSKTICNIFKIDMDKLPKVVESNEVVGTINAEIAEKTGLAVGTAILGGLIDSTAVQYGSGAIGLNEQMVYWGTSGWIGTVIDKLKIDLMNRCGALITAQDKRYHYYCCLDSAGISYRWLKEHIISDDGLLNVENGLSESEIYKHMNKVLSNVPTGADGLIYAPWITGCRAPMEASDIGGMFVNIKRNMGKKHFARAVIEGICYHYRLLQECSDKVAKKAKVVKFVGGGAKSDEIAQILADVLGCKVEIPESPQDAGAYGAAIYGFYAMNKDGATLEEMAHKQVVDKTFVPNKTNHEIYNKYYSVYKKLYKKNHRILSRLTEISEGVAK